MIGRERIVTRLIVFLLLTTQQLPSQGIKPAEAQDQAVRRILIINEVDAASPAIPLIDDGLRESLQGSRFRIQIYREYMQANLFPDVADQRIIRDFYIRKYRNHRPDLIITVGNTPLQFMMEEHNQSFPGVPVVYCLSNNVENELKPDPLYTGVKMTSDAAGTVAAALRLLPDTKRVVVIGGSSPFDHQRTAVVMEQLKKYAGRLDISYWTDLAMPQIQMQLRHLSKGTIVLFNTMGRDAAGTYYTSRETGPLITSASAVPVFTLFDVFFGNGEVGGHLAQIRAHGFLAGKAALKIFDGVTPSAIPIANVPIGFVFDWRALKRWGLSESNLPPGSTILNRPPTAWEQYKWYFIAAITLILIEAVLISALVSQRIRRRRTEKDLAITNERLRLSVEIGQSVGWDWEISSGKNRWFGNLQSIFGIPGENYETTVGEFFNYVYPDDHKIVRSAMARARDERKPYVAEFRIVRRDAVVRWLAARGGFHYSENGSPERMVGMAMDVTERKTAEEALVNLSGRLISAQEEERSRIAREIHDDYQQRLAMFANDLDGIRQDVASEDVKYQLRSLWNDVSELAADMHSLSHRLHSSTLETLGLAAGIETFCREFQDQHGLVISFAHEDIPRGIPSEVALCLFRVTQESLRNIKRHSGTNQAEVWLGFDGKRLLLSVSDKGSGFDASLRSPGSGIGIRSMQERLRLVGGHLEIDSKLGHGTAIDAWVPLEAVRQAAS